MDELNYSDMNWCKNTIASLREQLKDITAAQIYLRERDSLREQLSNMMAVVASVERERDELLKDHTAARIYLRQRESLEKQLAAMTKERDAYNDGLKICESDYRELDARFNELESKYNNLIFAVGDKWPNETRHETARRYIIAATNQANGMLPKTEMK